MTEQAGADASAAISTQLRYAIEHKYPHPIALTFSLLYGIENWMAEDPKLAHVVGVTLQHVATVALANYLSSEARDPAFDSRLHEILDKPSYGKWIEMTRGALTRLPEGDR